MKMIIKRVGFHGTYDLFFGFGWRNYARIMVRKQDGTAKVISGKEVKKPVLDAAVKQIKEGKLHDPYKKLQEERKNHIKRSSAP
jgi:hypothetical protein